MKEIPLTKGYVTMVDDEDYNWLLNFNWVENGGYAVTSTHIDGAYKQNFRMHRMIIDVPADKVIDHINGDKLDNRKENLRIATAMQNSWNTGKQNKNKVTSKFKGVSYDGYSYTVKIACKKKKEHIGSFSNELAAANAYNYYAKLYFGDFARLNDTPFMTKEEWENYKSRPTSEYKGVTWAKDIKRWATSIYDKESRTQEFVGYFDDEIVAANYVNHLSKNKINQCEFIPLSECEQRKHKRKKTSKYRGVSLDKNRGIWETNVWDGNKKYFVGYFKSEIEAAEAYNQKAIELNVKNLDKKLNKIN